MSQSEHGADARLRRELGLTGAIFMGLGAILGTGVFVSIGIAAGVAGSLVPYFTLFYVISETRSGQMQGALRRPWRAPRPSDATSQMAASRLARREPAQDANAALQPLPMEPPSAADCALP